MWKLLYTGSNSDNKAIIMAKFLGLFVTIILFHHSLCEDQCRDLTFPTSEIKAKQSLRGHVIKTVEVETQDTCVIKCFIEHLCSSFNIGPTANGRYLCELSDSDYNMHPEDLVQRPGFHYHGSNNPCKSSPCVANATCLNGFTDKGYQCKCPNGYQGKFCHEDIDECASVPRECDVNATCSNTIGSFNCSCLNGFSGNGKQCAEIDECQENTHNCSGHWTCVNTPGSFTCVCEPGFGVLGEKCLEIKYGVAAFAQNCDEYCDVQSMKCVSNNAFPTGSAYDIFTELDLVCTGSTSHIYPDQPCYYSAGKMCYGIYNIPAVINCAVGKNYAVQRVCPCVNPTDA